MLYVNSALITSVSRGALLMLAKALELVFGNQDVMVLIVSTVVVSSILMIVTDLFRGRYYG